MRAYYNEFDPKAAAWLRELIRRDLIAPGDVDERSILDVRGSDLEGYGQCHFFAGIGGWSLALRLAGWPDDQPVWTGSCPCQPFSNAGQRKGTADSRHLWPEFHRLISLRRPAVVFGEQVASKAGRLWLSGVRTDVEALDYALGAADLCAAGIGSPHIRQRLWWVAEGVSDSQHGRSPQQESRAKSRAQSDGVVQDSSVWLSDSRDVSESKRPRPSRGKVRQRASIGIVAGGDCNLGGTPDSDRPGCGERSGTCTVPPEYQGPQRDCHDAWGNYVVVPCADGFARRIEPGLEPVAHGLPARVGRLRGYGNAIVPQVAAEFISAYCES